MTHTTRAPKINADMSPMLCYVMDWLMADTFDAVSYMTNFVGQGFFFFLTIIGQGYYQRTSYNDIPTSIDGRNNRQCT